MQLPFEPVVRRPHLHRVRHVLSGAASMLALVGALALARSSGSSEESAPAVVRLSTTSWSWGDQPMTVDPADAAVQAASLAHVANQGFQAEQHKLAGLRMVQVAQMSGALSKPTVKAAERTLAPMQPFAPEIAQRLRAVDGAAQDAQAEAMQVTGHGPLSGRLTAWAASASATGYLGSHDLALPTRTTRNGLALDYFHLSSLPAATAVRFAKREVVGAMAKPAAPSPGLLTVDQKAKQAFQQGTDIVVKRRQKAGILPMPINKAWNYENKKVKEAVGENVVQAQRAAAKAETGSGRGKTPATMARDKGAANGVGRKVITPDKLKKLEAEVQRLKEQQEMEDMLNSLQGKEATLEKEYPQLQRGKDSSQDTDGEHAQSNPQASAPALVVAPRPAQ
jgi:hypothetical protein